MYILNPGMDRTETNIIQHYYWHKLRYNIRTYINVCETCHKNKKQNLKYGLLSADELDATTWDILLVYLISQ